MRILVAGGAGYIGSSLVPVLLDHGYDVDVVDLLWFGNHLPPDVPVIKRDLFACTMDDLRGYDQVIFLAGLSNDPMAEFSPGQNFISNAALPAYLALIAKRAGVRRFIHASSCSVYGYAVDRLQDEQAPTTCTYPYGVSKLQGERGVHHFQDDSFSVISLRQGTVSGYSPRMRLDLIINTMFKCAVEENLITVNNPSIWRPILSLSDASVAFLRAIQVDYAIGGVFNVASLNCTVGHAGDVVRTEARRLLATPIGLVMRNVQDVRSYKVSTEKAETELGFQPSALLQDIVVDLYENREGFVDTSNDEYYNVRVFRRLEEERSST